MAQGMTRQIVECVERTAPPSSGATPALQYVVASMNAAQTLLRHLWAYLTERAANVRGRSGGLGTARRRLSQPLVCCRCLACVASADDGRAGSLSPRPGTSSGRARRQCSLSTPVA